MQLAIAIVSTLLSGTLVLLVPGAFVLAAWRLDRVIPPPLVPAAAAMSSLALLAPITAACLLMRLHIGFAAALLGLVTIALWRRTSRHTPTSALLRGAWLRATPSGALVAAALACVLALFVGFYAWNDSLYHIAQAQKLLALDQPGFSNTLQFADGSAHPGYLLPAWHMVLALTALVSRQDVATAAWILPALTFPIVLLATAGLAWVVARARTAASVAGFALLLLAIAGLPYSDAITNAMQPGVFALGAIAPLVVAMVLVALWPRDERTRQRHDDSPHAIARMATIIAAMSTAVLGMLHVSYLWVLGMGILGYYVLWLLRSPWPRDVLRRHLVTGAVVAVVAAAILAALYPGLSNLDSIGRSAAAELAATDNAQYQGENDANLEALLRGDPDGAYHLRGDYLVQTGGLALLALVGAALPLLLAPRWPGGWLLSGAVLLVLLIALSDRIFPAFVNVVTLDQARRIERVLPAALGLTSFVLMLGVAIARMGRMGERRRSASRSITIAATVGATGFVAFVVDAIPPLAGYAGSRIVEPRVLLAVLVVVAGCIVVHGAGLVVRLTRIRSRRAAGGAAAGNDAGWWPTGHLDHTATSVALIVLLVGAAPVYGQLRTVAKADRLTETPIEMRGAELRLFSDRVAAQLRELEPGSIVLADPRTRNPYTAMAIAPVYVVSSVPRHTARTPKNRVDERFDVAVEFFDDRTATDRRLQILHDEKVDAVLVHPAASHAMRTQLDGIAGVRMVATGKNQRLYLVDRTTLP